MATDTFTSSVNRVAQPARAGAPLDAGLYNLILDQAPIDWCRSTPETVAVALKELEEFCDWTTFRLGVTKLARLAHNLWQIDLCRPLAQNLEGSILICELDQPCLEVFRRRRGRALPPSYSSTGFLPESGNCSLGSLATEHVRPFLSLMPASGCWGRSARMPTRAGTRGEPARP
jgi:hypothetical protein